MTPEELDRWIDAMAASHREHAERMAAHEEQMQTMRAQHEAHMASMRQISARLATHMIAHETRITDAETRIAQNEETLKGVYAVLQAIKDMLPRGNGH